MILLRGASPLPKPPLSSGGRGGASRVATVTFCVRWSAGNIKDGNRLEDDEVDGGDLNASDKMSSLLAKG